VGEQIIVEQAFDHWNTGETRIEVAQDEKLTLRERVGSGLYGKRRNEARRAGSVSLPPHAISLSPCPSQGRKKSSFVMVETIQKSHGWDGN
jgi:hypothetical protein